MRTYRLRLRRLGLADGLRGPVQTQPVVCWMNLSVCPSVARLVVGEYGPCEWVFEEPCRDSDTTTFGQRHLRLRPRSLLGPPASEPAGHCHWPHHHVHGGDQHAGRSPIRSMGVVASHDICMRLWRGLREIESPASPALSRRMAEASSPASFCASRSRTLHSKSPPIPPSYHPPPEPPVELVSHRYGIWTYGHETSELGHEPRLGVARNPANGFPARLLGYSPREVGLLLIPNAIALAIVGPVSGRLSDLWGWRPFKLVGLGISATGLFFLSRINVDSPLTLAIAGLVLHGGGMGMFNTSNNSSILSTVDQSRYGVVSSFLNLVRNSANVTGIALATAIVTATMASKGYPASLETVSEAGGQEAFGAFTAGLRTTFFTMGCLILLGIALSLVKGKPASASLPIGDR